MKNILLLVAAVITFTACTIEDHSPKVSAGTTQATAAPVDSFEGTLRNVTENDTVAFAPQSRAEADSVDMLVIGKLSTKSKMSDWDKGFRPKIALGGLPQVGESLIVVRCDEGKEVRYCSTLVVHPK